MIINMNGAKAPETPSPVLQEKTVTPQTLPTVIGADEGYTGLSQVTVNPDTNLKAENIRSGKTIFGVGGTFVGEPVYTDELDNTKLMANARTLGGTTVVLSATEWNTSPTRLTELDYTKADWFNSDVYLFGYNGDAVIDGDGVPRFSTSSVYNPNDYYFYKEHGSYEGLVTLYIPYRYVMSTMGWNDASNYPTHIRGILYVYLTLCASNDSNGIIGNDFRTSRNYGYGSPFYEIEVDSNIEVVQIGSGSYDKALAFTINVPKIEGDVVGYVYSAPVRTGAVLSGVFRKTVIS